MQGNGEHHANDERLPATARADGFGSPFDRAAWFDLLEAHGFAGQGRIDAHGRAGGVTAWLPLRIEKPGDAAGLTNWYSFAIRPLYTGEGDRGGALDALCRVLRRSAARLTLYPVSDPDDISAALRAAGWWVKATPAGDRHWLDLGNMDHDAWWASRPGALRSTVQRKAKKGVVALQLHTAFDHESWAAYEHIYAASWKPEEGHPALLRAFAEAEGAAGRMRMGIARIDGIPIAAQFWTVEDGTAFIHKLAHREDARALSPGSVLSAALFRHVIDGDHVAMVDFGTGNDGYKRDWMEEVRPRYRLDMFRPFAPGNWPVFAGQAIRRLARKGNHG